MTTPLYYHNAQHDDRSLTVFLKSHEDKDLAETVIIGIEQFEAMLDNYRREQVESASARAVKPRFVLPKPLTAEFRNKECDGCGKTFFDDSHQGNMHYCCPQCRPSQRMGAGERDKICITCHTPFYDDTRCNNMQFCHPACRCSYQGPKKVDGRKMRGAKSKIKKAKKAKKRKTPPKKRKLKGVYPVCLWCGDENIDKRKPYCCKTHERQAEEYKVYSEGSEA